MNCSICKSPISHDEEITKCENCKNDFHLECWSENGGCGTPGCINLPNVVKSQAAATKTCPACGETIGLGEVVCPFCNERFTTIAPISAEELKNSFTQPKPVIKERKGAIAVLIFGLLGFTAPFNLIFGGIWYQQNKKILKETSPLHNILAVLGLAVSVFYTVIISIGIFR